MTSAIAAVISHAFACSSAPTSSNRLGVGDHLRRRPADRVGDHERHGRERAQEPQQRGPGGGAQRRVPAGRERCPTSAAPRGTRRTAARRRSAPRPLRAARGPRRRASRPASRRRSSSSAAGSRSAPRTGGDEDQRQDAGVAPDRAGILAGCRRTRPERSHRPLELRRSDRSLPARRSLLVLPPARRGRRERRRCDQHRDDARRNRWRTPGSSAARCRRSSAGR